MKKSTAGTLNPNASRRRGILAAWSIWIMMAATLMAAGLFNVLWTSGIRAHARQCAEASAIFAGHSYLSDDLLRNSQQPFEHDGRCARCRGAAVAMSEEYSRHSSLPKLSDENVTLEWPDTATILKHPSHLVPSRITVGFNGSEDGLGFPLLFRGMSGLVESQAGVSATVALRNDHTGFRPGPKTPVPMLPFAIVNMPGRNDESTAAASGWAESIEAGRGADNFGWDPERHQFENGPDGLPEITVTIYFDESSGDDALIPLCFRRSSRQPSERAIATWISSGLSYEDLQTFQQKEITFPSAFATCRFEAQQLDSVSAALQAKAGQPCILSLCQPVAAGADSRVNLTRPVAARIVRAIPNSDGNLVVVLQPCVLVTATAIDAPDSNAPVTSAARNRYIYSVRLSD